MKYKVIYADPPWLYDNAGTQRSRGMARSAYECMPIEEIKALPIASITDKDCLLFLWATMPKLREALEVVKSWGFCVGKKTKILTRDLKYVSAESLKVGDSLVGFDEFPTGNRRYFKTTKVVSTGILTLPCYDIYLESGEILRASSEHAWLMQSYRPHGKHGVGRSIHWVKTKDIEHFRNYHTRKVPLGMPILMPKFELVESYESGFLSAAFDSEGTLRGDKPMLSFAQNKNELFDVVNKYLELFKFDTTIDIIGNFRQIRIKGGHKEALRFLMQMRPPRLLKIWESTVIENMSLYNQKFDLIKQVIDVGRKKVVTLQTDTSTYIAEGYGAHNTYITCAFVWIKLNPSVKNALFFQQKDIYSGLGHWVNGNAELVLLGRKGKPKRAIKNVKQIVIEPRSRHSEKPEEVRRRIDLLTGNVNKIELFARKQITGWTTLGNALDNKDIKESLEKLILL